MDVSTFTAHRRSLDTPAGEIAYTELGSGPVALFVHGLGTNGVLWRHVIEDLRDTSRCIAIDLPLHGGTPGREPTCRSPRSPRSSPTCATASGSRR